MSRQETFALLKSAAMKCNRYNVPRLGASLAYYALLSMAPLLILLVAIGGLVLNRSTAEHNLLQQAQDIVGPAGAKTLRSVIDNAHHARSGIFASIVAVATLFFGASGVFTELRDSLNTIWDAKVNDSSGWNAMLWQRIVAFGMILALGFLLLLSLLLSTILGVVEKFLGGLLPLHWATLGEISNLIFSLLAMAVLFALIFKFVPAVPIDWKDVVVGALVTSLLFSVGRGLLALYLRTAAVGSTYGAAGSLVALVVWVYYSAQIFFYGASLTRIYADTYGSYANRREAKLGRAAAL
jgi:membrane protein